ncbi:MAG: hypothetical protein OXH39_10700 [Candidatus Poribacteria bacterium]|nr:hypothetical protein [Candidatus Poribacteria bacterium]
MFWTAEQKIQGLVEKAEKEAKKELLDDIQAILDDEEISEEESSPLIRKLSKLLREQRKLNK